MERQYIGARYVPKFADPIEWNDQTSYEALTIVTYMGASYTSKKRVPVGVRPTDSVYWVITGNYNAQVEEYRQIVEQLREDIFAKDNRKWIFIGDSYDEYSGWVNKAANLLGLTTGQYFNLAVSGHAFYNGVWLNDLKTWVANNPNEVSKIGYIVVGGGLNDSHADATAELGRNMLNFGNYCKSTFTDTKVMLTYFGWEIDSINTHRSTPVYRASAQTLYSRASAFNMEYLSGCECAVHNRSLMDSGGIHPTDEGGRHIAWAVTNAIKTGYGAVNWNINYADFTPLSGTLGDASSIQQSITSNIVYTHGRINLTDAAINLVGGQAVDLGTLILPLSNAIPWWESSLFIRKDSGEFENAPCRVIVTGDKLKIMYLGLNEGKTGYADVTATQISLFWSCAHNAIAD